MQEPPYRSQSVPAGGQEHLLLNISSFSIAWAALLVHLHLESHKLTTCIKQDALNLILDLENANVLFVQ